MGGGGVGMGRGLDLERRFVGTGEVDGGFLHFVVAISGFPELTEFCCWDDLALRGFFLPFEHSNIVYFLSPECLGHSCCAVQRDPGQ